MKICRITEKKMRHKRFRKTEYTIFKARCKFRDYPTAYRIAKYAKISRSTFYRHHRNAKSILNDYEELLFIVYKNAIRELIQKNANEKTLFLRTLVFISNHSVLYCALLDEGRTRVVKKMLSVLKPTFIVHWKNTSNLELVYNIYENEVLGVIEAWGKLCFASNRIDKTLRDILRLTETAPGRLGALIGEE